MLARLSLIVLPLIVAAGCASEPAQAPHTTSSYDNPDNCPTGTRVCRRGTTPAQNGVATMSADDLRNAAGAPPSVAR